MSRLAVEAEKLRLELRFTALVHRLDAGSRVQVAGLLERMAERLDADEKVQR